MWSDLLYRLRAVFRRNTLEEELDDELRFHFEQHVRKHIEAGLTNEEALRRARLSFGGIDQVKEECRQARGVAALDSAMQDLRYSVRVLRKSPVFTTVAVLSLALGIGVNTAVFSLINDLLLREINVSDPAALVSLRRIQPRGGSSSQFDISMFEELRDHNTSTRGMLGWGMSRMGVSAGNRMAEMISTAFYSGNAFSLLGVRPLLGREFTPEDDRPGRRAVAVISYEFWRRYFGGNDAVLGDTMDAKGIPLTIIGVMPPAFTGLAITDTNRPLDLMLPLVWYPRFLLNDESPTVNIVARLKPGMSLGWTRAELNVVFSRSVSRTLDPTLPDDRKRALLSQSLELKPAGRGNPGRWEGYKLRLSILMGVVAIVLLICCGNVANLMLARAAARQRELAVRLAIGAARRRLIRQLLTESLAVGILGGSAGLLIAVWGNAALSKILGLGSTLVIDWRVLGFTASLSLVTGMLFGLTPAFRFTRIDLSQSLKERAQRSEKPVSRPLGLGRMLVSVQVALSLSLMIGAGLLLQTLRNLDRVDVGFDRQNVLLFWIYPTVLGYEGSKEIRVYQDLLERFNRIPGVVQASMARHNAMQGGLSTERFRTAGSRSGRQNEIATSINAIAPGFFGTMRIPVIAGRDFSSRDTVSSARVAMVNRKFALDQFGAENPVGKHIIMGDKLGQDLEIVGVVRDFLYHDMLVDPAVPSQQVFLPFTQAPRDMLGQMCFVLRTARDPLSVVPDVRREAQKVDRNLAVGNPNTQADEVQASIGEQRSLAKLITMFGALAVLLACIGLYGVVSYKVARRTGEIGIRIALGARQSDVLTMILRESALMVVSGVAFGIPIAFAATRYLSSILYGIKPYDAATFACGVLLLTAIASLAASIPAARAARVDPLVALRYE